MKFFYLGGQSPPGSLFIPPRKFRLLKVPVVIILVVVLNHSLGVTLAPHYPECRYIHPRVRQNLEHFLCYDVSPIRMV
jgi:hypothetical protein